MKIDAKIINQIKNNFITLSQKDKEKAILSCLGENVFFNNQAASRLRELSNVINYPRLQPRRYAEEILFPELKKLDPKIGSIDDIKEKDFTETIKYDETPDLEFTGPKMDRISNIKRAIFSLKNIKPMGELKFGKNLTEISKLLFVDYFIKPFPGSGSNIHSNSTITARSLNFNFDGRFLHYLNPVGYKNVTDFGTFIMESLIGDFPNDSISNRYGREVLLNPEQKYFGIFLNSSSRFYALIVNSSDSPKTNKYPIDIGFGTKESFPEDGLPKLGTGIISNDKIDEVKSTTGDKPSENKTTPNLSIKDSKNTKDNISKENKTQTGLNEEQKFGSNKETKENKTSDGKVSENPKVSENKNTNIQNSVKNDNKTNNITTNNIVNDNKSDTNISEMNNLDKDTIEMSDITNLFGQMIGLQTAQGIVNSEKSSQTSNSRSSENKTSNEKTNTINNTISNSVLKSDKNTNTLSNKKSNINSVSDVSKQIINNKSLKSDLKDRKIDSSKESSKINTSEVYNKSKDLEKTNRSSERVVESKSKDNVFNNKIVQTNTVDKNLINKELTNNNQINTDKISKLDSSVTKDVVGGINSVSDIFNKESDTFNNLIKSTETNSLESFKNLASNITDKIGLNSIKESVKESSNNLNSEKTSLNISDVLKNEMIKDTSFPSDLQSNINSTKTDFNNIKDIKNEVISNVNNLTKSISPVSKVNKGFLDSTKQTILKNEGAQITRMNDSVNSNIQNLSNEFKETLTNISKEKTESSKESTNQSGNNNIISSNDSTVIPMADNSGIMSQLQIQNSLLSDMIDKLSTGIKIKP